MSAQAVPSAAFASARVLIVDDVAVNRRVLALKLQQVGFTKLQEAENGLLALQAIQQANSKRNRLYFKNESFKR
jgi:CheY-like chemotaxis protein